MSTKVGWYGYDDAKIARLTREAIAQGFNHFKLKVGGDFQDDVRRLQLVRSIIDDPKECAGRAAVPPETVVGKNAGPTGSVLMIDANQGEAFHVVIRECHAESPHVVQCGM